MGGSSARALSLGQYRSARHDCKARSFDDLRAARELFRAHLIYQENVIATVPGRYRIRKGDPLFPWVR